MTSLSSSLNNKIAAIDFGTGESLELSNQGEVRRFRIEEQNFAIKQPKGHGLARSIRTASLKHEYRAYRKLSGITGIPTCFGLISGRLVLEYVQGTPLRSANLDSTSPYFATLLQLIRAMHARGVAHGDLKRKSNLLIDSAGQPVIIDFGTAIIEKPGWRPINQRLFNFICQTDLNAWIKLKYGGYENLSPEDARIFRRTRIENLLSVWRRP